jgi:S-adenosylmethionine hydrolase
VIPIVCFTSDFGLEDAWVGVCHATIYRTCPQAKIVDLAHQMPPFDLRKGAFVAASGVWQLPKAVHLVVVDPGVGGGRRDVCIVTGTGVLLVGPDNGVLMLSTRRVGGVAEAYEIDPGILRPKPPLPTFHARDILAPAAATLASGVEPEAIGEEMDPQSLEPSPIPPTRIDGGTMATTVLDVDRFGSVRIGISPDDLDDAGVEGGVLEVGVGHMAMEMPYAATFSDVGQGDTVAMVDSSGWLTLAVREGSAAERFGIEVGMDVTVRGSD